MMLSISTVRQRRGEWLEDSLSFVMLDSNDCLHRVSKIWLNDHASEVRWVIAWTFMDNPYSALQVASLSYATAEGAMDWINRIFAEHYMWFEAETPAA